MREAVLAAGAQQTLEIGLGYGIGTLFILEGLLGGGRVDARHVAIDPFQWTSRAGEPPLFGGAGVRALEEAEAREHVELFCEASEIVLPRLLAEGRRFDFAFVDGSHRFENVFLDLIFCARLLGSDDPVFVDDMHHPSVAHAVAYCTSNLGWTVDATGDSGEDHWTVLRSGSPERLSRPFGDFRLW